MTRTQIVDTISKRPLDEMQVIHVKCRPPEKSNKVLVTTVGKHKWYCERPAYFWSPFDRSFVERGFLAEQKFLYPDISEPLGLLDKRGLWWGREELSSFGLVKHFLKNPAQYLLAMSLHTQDVSAIVMTLKKIRPTLTRPKLFAHNLRTFAELYSRMYRFQASIYIVFDELAWQFRELLLAYLPKEKVNVYFPKFLSGEATREALRHGLVKERGNLEYQTTRGVLFASHLTAHAFYVQPKFFQTFAEDQEILNHLISKRVPAMEIQKFLAFRTIVPAGYQINEEAQFIETVGTSAHLGILMRAIAKKLNREFKDFQSMTVESIIRLLHK